MSTNSNHHSFPSPLMSPPDISTPLPAPIPRDPPSFLLQSADMDIATPASLSPVLETYNEPPGVFSTREQASFESEIQCKLPMMLPTPGRGWGQLTEQVHDNLNKLNQDLGKQDKVLNDLIKQVQRSRFHVESKINKLAEQTDQSLQNLYRVVSSNKDKNDSEMDTIMKAIKTVVSEEMDRVKVSLVSELGFMVDQLQIEVQRDLKDMQKAVQEKNTELVNHFSEYSSALKSLSTRVDEMGGKLDTQEPATR